MSDQTARPDRSEWWAWWMVWRTIRRRLLTRFADTEQRIGWASIDCPNRPDPSPEPFGVDPQETQ